MTKKLFLLFVLIFIFSVYGFASALSVGAEEGSIKATDSPLPTEPVAAEPETAASSSPDTIESPNATSRELILNNEQATTTSASIDTVIPDTDGSASSSVDMASSLPSDDIGIATSTPVSEQQPAPEPEIGTGAPVGEIIFPAPNTIITGNAVSIKIRITNSGSGLANVLFYLSDNNGTFLGETSQPDKDGLYTMEWNPQDIQFSQYGPHYLYAAILGANGEASNPTWVPINIGN